MPTKFEFGQIVSTLGAMEKCSMERMAACMARHLNGDWGELDDEDIAANNRAVREGNRILSNYPIDETKPAEGNNSLWIITEHDRSVTTFLLPSEY